MKLLESHLRKECEKLNYLVYGPEELKRGLPLITFLHGAGERGKHTENLFRHGLPMHIKDGLEVPAIVLVPQCHESCVWNNLVFELMELIDSISVKYHADKSRMSVTGGSMGGFGTWEMGLCFPNRFSCIAPICGGGLSWRASNLKTTPVYAYHGTLDTVVPPVYSQLMADAVNNAGGNARLTLFENAGHIDAINMAYIETDLIEKLLNTVRTDFTPVPESHSEFFDI